MCVCGVGDQWPMSYILCPMSYFLLRTAARVLDVTLEKEPLCPHLPPPTSHPPIPHPYPSRALLLLLVLLMLVWLGSRPRRMRRRRSTWRTLPRETVCGPPCCSWVTCVLTAPQSATLSSRRWSVWTPRWGLLAWARTTLHTQVGTHRLTHMWCYLCRGGDLVTRCFSVPSSVCAGVLWVGVPLVLSPPLLHPSTCRG